MVRNHCNIYSGLSERKFLCASVSHTFNEENSPFHTQEQCQKANSTEVVRSSGMDIEKERVEFS